MSAITRFHIALDLSTLDDVKRAGLIAGVQKLAPQSTLMQIPAIAASVAALGKKGATLVTSNAAVGADEKQLKADVLTRDVARNAVDVEFVTLRTLVANNATAPSDITSMGFLLSDPASRTRTQPAAPSEILTRFGKAHGKARVTVNETGTTKGRYVAESSPDPIGPATWSPLPGNGKQRVLTGATGTKVWVRFAQVRYGLQSDWSAPVLVTLP
jgi:hypothetical protein